jgi:hypothetical protein
VVQSHLIRHGFVKDYTVCKYHDEEADPSATGASRGNSSTVNDGGQQPSASTSGDSANDDYINIQDLFKEMVDDNDGGGGDGEQIDVLGPKDAQPF